MNKEIYKQNITALRNKYPAWANIIKNRHKKKNIDVIVEKSVTGDTILKVKKNGKILYLNGKYAPDEVGKQWIKKQGKIDAYATIVILGISMVYILNKLWNLHPKHAIY